MIAVNAYNFSIPGEIKETGLLTSIILDCVEVQAIFLLAQQSNKKTSFIFCCDMPTVNFKLFKI
jgi:hypothetical protein